MGNDIEMMREAVLTARSIWTDSALDPAVRLRGLEVWQRLVVMLRDAVTI